MKKCLIALASALCVTGASAAVYDTAGVGPGIGQNNGNQNYGQMLGLDFTVNVGGLQVTEFGAFNDGLNGITTDIQVALFDLTTNSVVSPTISFNGATGSGTYLFQSLANPITLVAGHQYSIQALGFNGTDRNYNTNVPGVNNDSNDQVTTPITFNSYGGWLTNNDSRYGGASFGAGTNTFAHSSTFGAATLSVSAVPEPETYAMMLAGLGVMGFLGRRRKQG